MNENVSSDGNKHLGINNLSITDTPQRLSIKVIDDDDDEGSVRFALLSPKLEQVYTLYSNTITKPNPNNNNKPSKRSI